MRYAIVGPGRMGRAIETEAAARGHECARRFGRADSGVTVPPLSVAELSGVEVAFEFTRPTCAEDNVVALLEAGVNVVCGTTGWTPSAAARSLFERSRAALVLEPNFSIGVLLFSGVVAEAARRFGGSGLYEAWIHESHHSQKRDAPSGTARRLAQRIAESDPDSSPPPVASTRAGHDPGTHIVGFDGPHDRITLTHQARSRAGFALGAVLAAEWIRGQRGVQSLEALVERSWRRSPTEKGESS